MSETVLVRYGAISEVARFRVATAESIGRGTRVVVQSPRGTETGMLLETIAADPNRANGLEESDLKVLRQATDDDERRLAELQNRAQSDFAAWCERICEWKLNLELIDLEWMLEGDKLVLYVLNDRGPDCTKLALQAAAGGLGIIEVQPVGAEGLMTLQSGHGCGSGGCGSCG